MRKKSPIEFEVKFSGSGRFRAFGKLKPGNLVLVEGIPILKTERIFYDDEAKGWVNAVELTSGILRFFKTNCRVEVLSYSVAILQVEKLEDVSKPRKKVKGPRPNY